EEDDPDSRRRRQRAGFLPARTAGIALCKESAPHRARWTLDREGLALDRRAVRALRFPRGCGREGRRRCEARRSRPALASVRELRHVSQLCASRRSICRGGKRARRLSATYVFARNAPAAEYDRSLAWAALLLATTGLVMVYSASIATAEASRYTGNNAAWFLARHGVFLGVA